MESQEGRSTATVAPCTQASERGVQIIQEQRLDYLQDVLFSCVMRSRVTPLFRLHHGLEERAEDGGRNSVPGESTDLKQQFPHVGVKRGNREPL